MGYDLHITRKENWYDDESGKEILLTEWTTYVSVDPDMRLGNFAEATADNGQKVRFDNDGLSVWTKYSKDGVDGNYAWFAFLNGDITVKNPDTEIRNKMIDIASSLSAKVQGDDGEFYDSKHAVENGRPNDSRPTVDNTPPWWKFW